jgi:hypothetical protein
MEIAVNRKQLVGRILAKARKYRSFARWISDGETAQRILSLADKLGWRARVLESDDAPGKSGRKTASRWAGMKSSGLKPNASSGKLKISQSKTEPLEARHGRSKPIKFKATR